ncbi:hypothetical protein FHR83_000542 [Actinoplanes campanulatus]|uniref:NurA domain-containing protein n=1 Tax=Actinoplanes campanulatus TaxID=113559 RepID=A0A7W5AAV4_9ACTN|nr:hypothetical protein [Actinoplanes campanulatus]MBB3092908.1 hypothetical protein [Actinoplanes campanulatus]GGM99848.1 hypothetical protein GCM10010109_04700 [Actinoplanes campanulatus]GID33996.1 hypothetical protein Aca09nite_05020 [Actinoplanes campanulatus]
MTRVFVDAWDPSYGASFEGGDGGDGPGSSSSAQVDVEVEVPAAEWAPIDVPAGARVPDVVFLVDGVRRNDAQVWTAEDDGTSYAGLAASFAAGVVRCDLARGAAELAVARVGRGLFTASPSLGDVRAGTVRYEVHRVSGPGEASKLPAAVQGPLTALEIEISSAARDSGSDGTDLLIVDGPLRNRRQLPRTIGYVKTQQKHYLPAAQEAIVPRLRPGQRTPVFQIGTVWGGWSWYLRLPGSSGAPWSGIVRVECSPELSPEQAIELAEVSLATLPRFASSAYKDPRAPQNLVPIAGLERRLRGMLGDARVLHRALARDSARAF